MRHNLFVRAIDWAFGDTPDRSYLVVCVVLFISVMFVGFFEQVPS